MSIIRRFGAALNLNVHVHALVIDGVFADILIAPTPVGDDAPARP